ncbi:MAG TPA: hypothetical protein PLR60_11760 [Syntrophorhabdaceae bacterium]|nr:hypothetical protein [Syntrophorhabdaceae bacterium]
MKELNTAKQRAVADKSDQSYEQKTGLCSEEKMAGCLFHDMMKYHGQSGCRERGCHCPLSGPGPDTAKRTH